MKVHPLPFKRNTAIRAIMDSLSPAGGDLKRLRRLPHVFGKVLELPFVSDADVSIEETPDFLRFSARTAGGIGADIRARAVEVHPGVTKIVVRNGGGGEELWLSLGEMDVWRFRLPAASRPEHASSAFEEGDLVVTVPKIREGESEGGELWGGMRRVVIVQ